MKFTNLSAFFMNALAAVLLVATPAAASTVVEFYHSGLDHYFITADANEAAAVDKGSAGPGWVRTGNSFYSGGPVSVCRFYGSQKPGPNSHFYTADVGECNYWKQQQALTPATEKRWNFESLDFASTPAPANGVCPASTVPVYRAYNNGWNRGIDSNHRLSTSTAAIQEVVSRGWNYEGVVMCAPATDVLHYTDKVYALWDGYMPWVVTKTGATRVINKTHLAGIAPIGGCWIAEKPLGDGTVLTACVDSRNGVEATRALYYINPNTEELHDYTGVIPADVVWNMHCMVDPATPTWCAETRVPDGWYFSPAAEPWKLYFKDDATGLETLVRSSPPNNVGVLKTYSY